MKKQPGVMLYFDIRPCLERLTMDDQGRLFNAILNYGEDGTEPDFDYMLGIAWDFIKPRLERDKARYEERIRQCEEAARRRWEKQADANAYGRIPTTPSFPTATLTPAANTLSQASTTPPGFPGEMVEILPQNTDFP